MQRSFIFEFFQSLPTKIRDLEVFIASDNFITTLNILDDMEKTIRKFREELTAEYIKTFKGES